MSLKIVCIGGGTGLPVLLRGFKRYVHNNSDKSDIINLSNLTAIVSVSDSGGSSGRLINEYDILPPGDIRNCLFALADEDIEPLMSKFFNYRFHTEEDKLLAGHSVGNLLLIALYQINQGNLRKAILDISNVLSIKGTILFPTLERTILCARLADGSIIQEEANIPKRRNLQPIESVFLSHRDSGNITNHNEVQPMEEAIEAIEQADVIILGPGSLYTSIIPNLLVKGISTAIRNSKAPKIYICNIMTEPGETDDYSVSAHVEAIRKHGNFEIDFLIANKAEISEEFLNQYAAERLIREYEIVKQSLEDAIKDAQKGEIGARFLIDKVDEQSKKLSYLSDEIRRISNKDVQVIFNHQKENLGKHTQLIEIEAVQEVEIEEDIRKKKVIRHDPDKLVEALIKVIRKE